MLQSRIFSIFHMNLWGKIQKLRKNRQFNVEPKIYKSKIPIFEHESKFGSE